MLSEELKTELAFGLKNLRIEFLKEEIEGRFLMPLSRLFHSFIQNGKKEERNVPFYRMALQKEV